MTLQFNKHNLIHHFLEESARKYPDKIALIHDETRVTFTEINSASNQFAGFLLKHGMGKGDRAVIFIENSIEYVIAYYGILKAGGVVAALSSDLKPDGLKPILDELEPVFLISSGKQERVLKATDIGATTVGNVILKSSKRKIESDNVQITDWDEIVTGEIASDINLQMKTDDLAGIIYTSGSTGKPKGVMLSHLNIVSNTHSICRSLNLTEKDIQMVVLPFFYVMGKSLLNTHFAVGGTVVINNRFAFPATVVNQMIEEKVTGFSGVPSTYAYLLHRSPLAKLKNELVSLRYCSQAGGHMTSRTKKDLRKALPEHTDVYIMYGATEASARITCLWPEQFDNRIESIGKPIDGVGLRVVDKNGCEAAIGETGELVASGMNIMRGYWKDIDSTNEKIVDGCYLTGDIGYRDEDGFFFVKARTDSLLKVGGHRINPSEIEDAIMAAGGLLECCVVGVPDKLLGNILVAVAVPEGKEVSEDDVLKSCSLKLPRYKVPQAVRFVKSLPKKSNGKVDLIKCKNIGKLKIETNENIDKKSGAV